MRWMKNTSGRPDAMLSVSIATVAVVLLKVLAAGISYGAWNLGPPPDAGLVAALLTPTLGAYVARRNGIGAGGIVPEQPKAKEGKDADEVAGGR